MRHLQPTRLHDSTLLVTLAALALAGCSDDGGGGSKGAGGSGGGGTITISGSLTEFTPAPAPADGGMPMASPAVGDADVCVLDDDSVPCVKSLMDGTFSISGVPANAKETGLTFTKAGYLRAAYLGSTLAEDISLNISIPNDDLAMAFAGLVGITWPDAANGVVAFTVFTNNTLPDGGVTGTALDGVSVALSPNDGKGPFYTTSAGLPDTTLTQTSMGSSLGFFASVPPGDHELTYTHPTKKTCVRSSGWESSKASSIKVRILAGTLVFSTAVCN